MSGPDIVERLHELEGIVGFVNGGETVITEAAATIEALRHDLAVEAASGAAASALHEAANDTIARLRSDLTAARGELAECQQVFEMRWESDQRAIKRWQEATGSDAVWPDATGLSVWLMEQLTAARAEAERLRAVLLRMEHACEQLAATRSHAVYCAIIDGGQAQEMLELDNARRAARYALSSGGAGT